jgi:2-iminobutanoate/2-iminopropanoate deaminase
MRHQAVRIEGAFHSGAPYSPAVVIPPFVFVSGAVPISLIDGSSTIGDIKAQTTQVLDNIESLLKEVDLGLEHIVKTTVFLTNSSMFKGMNEIYRTRFTDPFPARSTIQVGPLARPEFLIEIEAIAVQSETQ